MRLVLQPAFLLHRRPFRETSLLLEILTRNHGRVAAVARGVRTGRSRLRSLLQPFSPLLLSLQGRGELLTLQAVEVEQIPLFLQGDQLVSGFYLNELLMRFLPVNDPHAALFDLYADTLASLASGAGELCALRLFEKKLLDELGYGLAFCEAGLAHLPLLPERFYEYLPGQGFVVASPRASAPEKAVFPGRCLLNLATGELFDEESLRTAKLLLRVALMALPGARPLQSRRLFARNTT